MDIRKRDGFKNERYVSFPTENFPNYLAHPLVNYSYVTEMGFYPEAAHHYRERLDGADEGILFFCLDGIGTINVYTDSKWTAHIIKTNDLFLIPPRTPHIYYSEKEKPWTILWMHFSSPLLDELPYKRNLHPTMENAQKKEMLEADLVDFFYMDQKTITLENTIFMASLLKHILITIYYFADQDSHKRSYILTSCIQYMTQNLNEYLTLEKLTKRFNISSSYLNKIFISETGKAPIDFFTKLKVDEACKLLRISKLKVIEIASLLGYQDAYYFSRVFKKNMGVSPRTYRERFTPAVKDFIQ